MDPTRSNSDKGRGHALTSERAMAVAGASDPGILNTRWEVARNVYGLQRPIDLATFRIARLPRPGQHTDDQHIDVARFDDPQAIIAEIEMNWHELRGQQWAMTQCHSSTREARTNEPDGFHFLIRDAEEYAERTLVPGLLEVVARY